MTSIDYFDVVIIGSGVAGLYASICLPSNLKILILTKSLTLSGSTRWAQGGIASSLDFGDSWQEHFEDTLKAGNNINNKKAVEILCKEGPKCLVDLIKKGLDFDQKKEVKNLKKMEKLHFTKEAAHSKARILHIGGDKTGFELQNFLIKKVLEKQNIKILENSLTYQITNLDISKNNNQKIPINKNSQTGFEVKFIQKIKKQELKIIKSNFVILATGGSGQSFLFTTNPEVCTGDGLRLFQKLNLEFKDLEFYQFHPTALRLQKKLNQQCKQSQDFLISEAVRGEGGILKNILGEKFMKKYHKDQELAPRDIVTRAIWQEMYLTNSKFVFLDISNIGIKKFKIRFPTIYKKCLEENINLKIGIPVSPSAHYQMGGVKTNLFGQTSQQGIFAIGEVACTGVHGANRLASNSLLEGLVFAKKASKKISSLIKIQKNNFQQKKEGLDFQKDLDSIKNLNKKEKEQILVLEKKIKTTMWQKVSIIRTKKGLNLAFDELEKIRSDHRNLLDKINIKSLELDGILITSLLIVKAALKRSKSIGSHFIVDKIIENEL
jgi:L-aspartate oxidase